MKRKEIILLLTLMMIISSFCGCLNDNNGSDENSPSNKEDFSGIGIRFKNDSENDVNVTILFLKDNSDIIINDTYSIINDDSTYVVFNITKGLYQMNIFIDEYRQISESIEIADSRIGREYRISNESIEELISG